MENFLVKKSKIFYLVFLVLAFVVLISSVVYSTQYADVHVFFDLDSQNNEVPGRESQSRFAWEQTYMYDYFTKATDESFPFEKDFAANYQGTVYDFQKRLSSVNNFIVVVGVISLVAVALLFVLANHNRRVYYKSNLIGGVLLPLVVIIFNVILMARNFKLMGFFNENYELFNCVSVLQNRDTKIVASQQVNNYQYIKDLFSCNNATFIIYTIIFVVVILYALFMMFYSVYRYKASTEKRNQIMERAVGNND